MTSSHILKKENSIKGSFDPTELINGIRQLYNPREGCLSSLPWCEKFPFSFDGTFINLKVVGGKKGRGTVTGVIFDMLSILDPYEECSAPRTVLIEAEAAFGKTTFCEKYAFDWATKEQEPQGCGSTAFKVVLFLKCRNIHSDVWEAIDDQLLPRDIDEEVKQQFFQFIRKNQSSILLILDGLDELPTGKLSMFSELIEGRVLPSCYKVATARHGTGEKVRKCFDRLLLIKGFSENSRKEFVTNYFQGKPVLAIRVWEKISQDKTLLEMAACPLFIAFLCYLLEVCEDTLLENRDQLFYNVFECIFRTYRNKLGPSGTEENLTTLYEEQVNRLGSIALNGLLNDKLEFDESELGNHAKEFPELGYLLVQPHVSKLRPKLHYAFSHKMIQEFLAADFICSQIQSKKIKPEELVSDSRYFVELKQVLLFSCGILARQCYEQVVTLVKGLTNEVNKNEGRGTKVVLEAINQCESVHLQLAKSFGTDLNLTNLDLSENRISDASTISLAEAIKVNKTLTNLNLLDNYIRDAGATSIAEAIKVNQTLTNLNLSDNDIDRAGAASIAEAIRVNQTLTNLNLSENRIGDVGATFIAEKIKDNETLTNLDLSKNHIGDVGARSLAEAIKNNKTLTNLNFSGNSVCNPGATSFAKAIKANKTLTNLDLSFNDITDAGATSIAEAIKAKRTLTNLNLSHNRIGDVGAKSIAEKIKVNKTLTNLDLSGNHIGDVGATSLAEAIKVNKTLTNLNLSENRIDNAGATSLAEAIKVNKTLTNLNLSNNSISDAMLLLLLGQSKTTRS